MSTWPRSWRHSRRRRHGARWSCWRTTVPSTVCRRPRRAADRSVRLLRTGENVGYGAAANRAVAELPPEVEWVVVANPDIRWAPGSLDELLAAGRRWPRAGALGPVVREPDGAVYPSAREQPSLVAGAGHALLARVWPANPFSGAYRRSGEAPTERTAGWLSGSCLLLRRTAFTARGGFRLPVLHVLRGRRPRRPVDQGWLAQRLRPCRCCPPRPGSCRRPRARGDAGSPPRECLPVPRRTPRRPCWLRRCVPRSWSACGCARRGRSGRRAARRRAERPPPWSRSALEHG